MVRLLKTSSSTYIPRQNRPPSNAETEAKELFNTLRPGSLEYFEVLSFSHLGPQSLIALGTQRESLIELKLTSLSLETIRELPSLNTLPRLEVLSLTDSVPVARDEPFYTILGLVAEWMRSCTKLKRLELRKFMHDAKLLAQVLHSAEIRLTSLSFAGFSLSDDSGFLEVLKHHDSLQFLYLRGEENPNPAENDRLVDAVGNLRNLRELELKDVSDYFTMEQAGELAMSLPDLERLWISGEAFNDSIWPTFRCLQRLKSLAIYALSNFTANGVIDFVSQLGPGNRGMNLSIPNAISDQDFPENVQVMIRKILAENLDGTFDFGLAQGKFSSMGEVILTTLQRNTAMLALGMSCRTDSGIHRKGVVKNSGVYK